MQIYTYILWPENLHLLPELCHDQIIHEFVICSDKGNEVPAVFGTGLYIKWKLLQEWTYLVYFIQYISM